MVLDEKNFIFYAAQNYDNLRSSGVEEFYDDLKRFQYLKRLFKRYDEDNDLRLRLILNHMVVIYNCFGKAATNMIFFKLQEYHSYVKPFVIFLNYMPEFIEYEDLKILNSDIPLDPIIGEELRKI
jgi:hypothetical protein